MADEDGTIYWYRPDPRCIVELDRFRVSSSLRQVIRRKTFAVRVDQAFVQVIRACAERAEGTWISTEIMEVYCELHRRGHAHSVESWRDDQLVGGLYGLAIGGAFFGESMFYRASDASKVVTGGTANRSDARNRSGARGSGPHVCFTTVQSSTVESGRRGPVLPCTKSFGVPGSSLMRISYGHSDEGPGM